MLTLDPSHGVAGLSLASTASRKVRPAHGYRSPAVCCLHRGDGRRNLAWPPLGGRTVRWLRRHRERRIAVVHGLTSAPAAPVPPKEKPCDDYQTARHDPRRNEKARGGVFTRICGQAHEVDHPRKNQDSQDDQRPDKNWNLRLSVLPRIHLLPTVSDRGGHSSASVSTAMRRQPQ